MAEQRSPTFGCSSIQAVRPYLDTLASTEGVDPCRSHPQRLAERALETQLAPYLRNVNIAIWSKHLEVRLLKQKCILTPCATKTGARKNPRATTLVVLPRQASALIKQSTQIMHASASCPSSSEVRTLGFEMRSLGVCVWCYVVGARGTRRFWKALLGPQSDSFIISVV